MDATLGSPVGCEVMSDRQDDRGVAPVVGIALLIAITVILAGVIGSVIFGLSVDPSDTPEVTLSFTSEGDSIIVTHEGGERLDTSEVVIKNKNGKISEFDEGELRAGESVDTGIAPGSVDQISVVWQDPASDAENVLATFKP